MTTAKDLTAYDIFLILDKSGSMSEKDCTGGLSRWAYAKEAVEGLARKAAEFDQDGITVIPFSNQFKVYDNVGPEKVSQVFAENEPNGNTGTAEVLNHVLNEYFTKKAQGPTKPRILLVMTDGEPNDKKAVEDTIKATTQRMDSDGELGISFIQVGSNAAATAWLKHLDDGLKDAGAKFDIVDTITIDDMSDRHLVDVLIAALDD